MVVWGDESQVSKGLRMMNSEKGLLYGALGVNDRGGARYFPLYHIVLTRDNLHISHRE